MCGEKLDRFSEIDECLFGRRSEEHFLIFGGVAHSIALKEEFCPKECMLLALTDVIQQKMKPNPNG